MNDCLRRHSYDDLRREIRRIVLAGVVLLAMSTLWYAARPALIRRAALSSVGWASQQLTVGCGRLPLLAAALRQGDPGVPADDVLFPEYGGKQVYTHSFPRPGWVAWCSDWVIERDESGITTWAGARFSYADHTFRHMGHLIDDGLSEAPPGDVDGGGRWEIVLQHSAAEWEDGRRVNRWTVIRLGEERNDIVWIGLVDGELWYTRRAWVEAIWRDEDSDGVEELVFVTVVYVRLPGGGFGFKPPETVAVFEWDSPGGRLVPRHLPADAGILPWTPPPTGIVPVSQDARLQPVLENLHPLPPDFGIRRQTTQPTTAP